MENTGIDHTIRLITRVFLVISLIITTAISYLGWVNAPECAFICEQQLKLEAYGFFVIQVYAISSLPALYFTLIFILAYSLAGVLWQKVMYLKNMI